MNKTMKKSSVDEPKNVVWCKAHKDGECFHKDCPQLRDDEPKKSGRGCPLPWWDEAYV